MRMSAFIASCLSVALLLGQPAVARGPNNPALDEQKILDPDPNGHTGTFGATGIAINGQGNMLVPAELDYAGSGRVYAFHHESDGSWTYEQEISDSGGVAMEHFGYSLAMDNLVAVVGAPSANQNQGRACVFTVSGGLWTQVATLTPSDLNTGALFGYSVAISTNTILVSAPYYAAGSPANGAVYAYQKNGSGVWTQVAKFTASNVLPTDFFGTAIAVSGTTAMVLSPRGFPYTNGSLYVFNNVSGVWTQEQELHPTGLGTFKSEAAVLAMNATTAVLGAPDTTENSIPGAGTAYVFQSSGGIWSQVQQIGPLSANPYFFGSAVDVAGNGDILIGSSKATVGTNGTQGIAYSYVMNASGVYTLSRGWTASDGQASDYYGTDVAFDKGVSQNNLPSVVAIGAPGVHDSSGRDVGAVYTYPYQSP